MRRTVSVRRLTDGEQTTKARFAPARSTACRRSLLDDAPAAVKTP